MAFGGLKGTLVGSGASVTNPSNAVGSVAVALGDIVYVVFGEQTNLTATGVIDNLGNSYAAQNAGLDGGSYTGRAFWSIVTQPGIISTISVAAVASADDWACIAAVFEGPFAAAPLDANPVLTNTSVSNIVCPSTGALAQAPELVVGWAAASGGVGITATAPNTLAVAQQGSNNIVVVLGSQTVASTASVSPAFVNSANFGSVQGTASFMSRSLVAIAATGLIVGSPIIGSASIAGSHLAAVSKTTGSPVESATPAFTVFSVVRNLTAVSKTVGSPVIGAPFTSGAPLITASRTTGSPVDSATPAFTSYFSFSNALIAVSKTVASPTFSVATAAKSGSISGSIIFGGDVVTAITDSSFHVWKMGATVGGGSWAITRDAVVSSASGVLIKVVNGVVWSQDAGGVWRFSDASGNWTVSATPPPPPAFVTVGLLVGSPGIGAPVLFATSARTLTSIALTVGSPAIGTPLFVIPVAPVAVTVASRSSASPFTTGTSLIGNTAGNGIPVASRSTASPVMSSVPFIGSQHSMQSANVVIVPTITLVGKPVVAGAAIDLVVGSPVFSGPALAAVTKPTGITVASPVIDKPALGKKLAPSSLAVGSPILGSPTFGHVDLVSANLTVASGYMPAVRLAGPRSKSGSYVNSGDTVTVLVDGNSRTWKFDPVGGGLNILRDGVIDGAGSLIEIVNGVAWRYTPDGTWSFDNNGVWVVSATPPSLAFPAAVNVAVATLGLNKPSIGGAVSPNGSYLLVPTGTSSLTDAVGGTWTATRSAGGGSYFIDRGNVDSGGVTDLLIEVVNGVAWTRRLNGTWAFYGSGIWVSSQSPPLLSFVPAAGLTVASPALPVLAPKQQNKLSSIGITVASPTIGVPAGTAPSLPGTTILAPAPGQYVIDAGSHRWSFGVNAPPSGDYYVLRDLVNVTIPAALLEVDHAGLAWARDTSGQWWRSSGTGMVASSVPPSLAPAAAGLTVGSPVLGHPVVSSQTALYLTVASPVIGVPTFGGVSNLQPPIGIWIGATDFGLAEPTIGESHVLRAERLVVFKVEIGTTPLAIALAGNAIGTTDLIDPDVQRDAGSQLIYRQAAGLEKALADVDGFRLTATYAELVRDQWDPYKISSANLPYLAWATGVNLWEEDWDDTLRRWWVANQWELKSQRGSLLGTSRFVDAIGAKVVGAIVPPAKFFPGKSLTAEERAAYVARFPQLRLYPYVARVKLPWLCYTSNFRSGTAQTRRYNRNGCRLGPIRKFYTTNANAGGRYTRTATIWDRGVETTLTFRQITMQTFSQGKVTSWDEVTVPARKANHWYLSQPGKFPLRGAHPRSQNRSGIFLGSMDLTASRIVNIPRDGTLSLSQAKAIYQTISPGGDLLDVYPEQVSQTHFHPSPLRRRLFCGQGFLLNKFLPPSDAWRFTFERWYMFDYARVPDYRKASVYMNHARFGIHKYTAELRIKANGKWRPWFIRCNSFTRGHFRPIDTKLIQKVRRAVTASMAVRDTVRINTAIKRRINTNDSLPIDGSFKVGQYIEA